MSSITRTTIVLLGCSLCLGSALLAADPVSTWPQWRGPDRDSMVQQAQNCAASAPMGRWCMAKGGREPSVLGASQTLP